MFCDDRNVSEVDDERNLGISVFNEGRLSIFYELLDLVVVRSSSGKEIIPPGEDGERCPIVVFGGSC